MGRRKKCEQIKRTNNVMVRFTDAEYASISISAEQAGYPVAVYVRKSALDERIEVHYNITAELPELQKLIAEYSAIGNNLNQIAQYFHSGGFYSKSIYLMDKSNLLTGDSLCHQFFPDIIVHIECSVCFRGR